MNIAIVNDSPIAVRVLMQTLQKSRQHDLLWTAQNGEEAIARCREQSPDLILMDLVMPGLDGAKTTREIMRQCPTAVLLVTASIEANCSLAFQAMGAGALDIVQTPAGGDESGQQALLRKINQIELMTGGPARQPLCWTGPADKPTDDVPQEERLVAIGCSAGGPAALADIFRIIPKDFPAAFVVVQHIDPLFAPDLAQWLDGMSGCPVRIAEEGERLSAGTVRLAGPAGHLQIAQDGTLHYTDQPDNLVCKPSIDVLMNSAARHWQGRAMGLILTGMGRDGVQGLFAMRKRGWLTVAQDRASSAIYGMPAAAAEIGAAKEILPLEKIAERITLWTQKGE